MRDQFTQRRPLAFYLGVDCSPAEQRHFDGSRGDPIPLQAQGRIQRGGSIFHSRLWERQRRLWMRDCHLQHHGAMTPSRAAPRVEWSAPGGLPERGHDMMLKTGLLALIVMMAMTA